MYQRLLKQLALKYSLPKDITNILYRLLNPICIYRYDLNELRDFLFKLPMIEQVSCCFTRNLKDWKGDCSIDLNFNQPHYRYTLQIINKNIRLHKEFQNS